MDLTGAGGGGGGLPLKNPPVPSAGCGNPTTVTSGRKMIMSSGDSRHYNIDLPSPYDMNKPYRYIYASHGLGGNGDDITRESYYGLKRVADAANDPAIFIAPSGIDGRWGQKDHPLFDDILAFVKQNVCVDTTRVFKTGFSFGGMYSYSLSLNHQKDIRAAAGLGPANYNIWLPPKTRPADRLDANDRDERHDDPLGQWQQHDSRREVHRDRTRHQQWVHGAGEHSDMAIGRPILLRLRRVQARISGQSVHIQRRTHSPERGYQYDLGVLHAILTVDGTTHDEREVVRHVSLKVSTTAGPSSR